MNERTRKWTIGGICFVIGAALYLYTAFQYTRPMLYEDTTFKVTKENFEAYAKAYQAKAIAEKEYYTKAVGETAAK